MYQSTPQTLVVIDSSVDSYQLLAAGIVEDAAVGFLTADQDGVQQITTLLQQNPHVTNLHIVSHGTPGALQLGNTQLSLDTLDHYASLLQTWSSSSGSNGSVTAINLYGCNVAAGDAGIEFVERLHQLTGAAIAASRTLTGNRALGGNWDLEVTTGAIATNTPFNPTTLEHYPAVLASVAPPQTLTGSNTSWDDIGDTSAFGTVFGIDDASLLAQSDAYDGGLFLSVNGQFFQTPTTIDLTGQTLTAVNNGLSGLNVTVQYQADQTNPIIRAFYSFQNPTAAPITVSASIFSNLGSDEDSTVEASSSGNNILSASDRWAITSDGAFSDPVITHVFSGSGSPETTSNFSSLFIDAISATYNITIPANSTRSLLVFNELSADDTTAISGSTIFDTNTSVTSNGLLSGLTNQQLAEVVNWDFFENPASAPDPIDFTGGKSGQVFRGDNTKNTLQGTGNNDTIRGLGGNDKLFGNGGNDVMRGGGGADSMNGGGGNDRLFGEAGGDTLRGQGGSDQLDGGAGKDTLLGGGGNDVCIGGAGKDNVTGGGGGDLFVFKSLTDGGDTISDFNTTQDLIDLRLIFADSAFSGVTPDLQFAEFVKLVAVGSDTAVTIDADGSGTGTSFVTLATLTDVSIGSINAGNFVIA